VPNCGVRFKELARYCQVNPTDLEKREEHAAHPAGGQPWNAYKGGPSGLEKTIFFTGVTTTGKIKSISVEGGLQDEVEGKKYGEFREGCHLSNGVGRHPHQPPHPLNESEREFGCETKLMLSYITRLIISNQKNSGTKHFYSQFWKYCALVYQ
jgi:hypothetical protein